MRLLSLSGLLCSGLCVSACDSPAEKPTNLPWQVTLTAQHNPEVFHITVGQSSLRQVIEQLKSFPELAVFSYEDGKRSLEAYFGKQRLGLFEAKLVAEIDIDDATLTKLQQNASKREGMASGQWKFTLAEADLKTINDLPIRTLIYIPVIDYPSTIVEERFGKPFEIKPAPQKDVALWFYPDKNLILMLDQEGGDIFYYASAQYYPVLQQTLLTAKPRND